MPFIKLNIFDKQFKFKCDKNGKIIDDSPIVYFLDENNSFYFENEELINKMIFNFPQVHEKY